MLKLTEMIGFPGLVEVEWKSIYQGSEPSWQKGRNHRSLDKLKFISRDTAIRVVHRVQ